MADAQIRITADTAQAERALGSLTSSLKSLAGIAIGGALAKQFVDIADAATILSNKLKTVTNSSADAGIAFGEVARIAKLTGSNIGAVGDFFQKVALAGQGMGLSLADTTKITENFSKALAVTGTVGPSAASAMYQFGQSLGRGTVMFEDMKQLQESSAGTLELIARQFGKTSAQFLKDVQASKVGSQDLANALKRLGDDIDPTFNGMQKTVGQSLENVRTEFVKTIQKFENATGFFSKLASAIEWVGNNLGVVLPLVAAFVGAFAATKVIAIVTSLYEMVKVLRLIGTTGAVATALATGGLSAIAAAAGATAAYLAADKLFADMEKNEALKKQADEAKRLAEEAEKANRALNPANKPLVYEGPKIDLKALAESASLYTKALRIETQLIPLGASRMAQEKAVLDFAKEQKVEYEKIAKTKIADQIRSDVAANDTAKQLQEYRQAEKQSKLELTSLSIHDVALREEDLKIETEKLRLGSLFTEQMAQTISRTVQAQQATRAQLSIMQELFRLEDERYGLAIADVKEREIALAIRAKERELGVALTQTAKDQLIASLNLTIGARTQNTITKELLKLEDERYGLGIADLKQREIAVAIRAKERELGSALTQDMKDQLAVSLQLTQAARDREQITQSLKAATQSLTGVEAGKSVAGQIGGLDPTLAAQKANETLFNGLEYLRQQDLISEQTYQNAKVNAAVQAQAAIMDATKKQYESEALLRIQEQTGKQFGYEQQKAMAAEAARFEMLSTMEKTQFGIEQAANLFGALGAQNKKAFEAAKAFNMANAIMNTYMAATKALAMYPPPFSFVAAAAAVAMGLAQVAQIRSQSYSGRALGGPVMGGKPYIVGESGPELFTPSTTGSITPNNQLGGGGVTNVNFTIVANDTTGFDQLLASRKGVIQQIISDAMLEKGRRSMV